MSRLSLVFCMSFLCFVASCSQRPKKPQNPLNTNETLPTDQATCEAQDFAWDAGESRCYTQRAYCLLKSDGSRWDGTRCISLKKQCEEKGNTWVEGECLSIEAACEKRVGYAWVDNKCITDAEKCVAEGFRYAWYDDTCLEKSFARMCMDPAAPPALAYFLSVLRKRSGFESCDELERWAGLQTHLRLVHKDDRDATKISDVSLITAFTHLKKLELTNNLVSDLRPFARLKNLEFLDLQNNAIQSLEGLEDLTKLETLSLGYNEISNVYPLAGLSGLETLMLFGNQISDVTPLGRLTGLKGLYLNANAISNLRSLGGLKKLEIFDALDNPVVRDRIPGRCPIGNSFSKALSDFCERYAGD